MTIVDQLLSFIYRSDDYVYYQCSRRNPSLHSQATKPAGNSDANYFVVVVEITLFHILHKDIGYLQMLFTKPLYKHK